MADRRRVHIVDDEAKVRDSLALLMSTAGIDAKTYASAEAFLEAVPEGAAACVILDNQLPGMGGLDLIRHFASQPAGPAIIMITGYADVPTAVAAMKLGAFHFVQKPFDAEALLLTVEEALASADEVFDRQAEILEFERRRTALTLREQEVFALLVDGLPNKLIAHRLSITTRTAEHHRAAVMQKMQARTISHLVRMALRLGGPAAP